MLIAALCGLFAFVGIAFAASAHAQTDGDMPAGSRLITLHDRGVDQVFVSEAATLGEALKEAGVELDPRDTVEPGLDEELVASEYNVNIYRARPMVVVDGMSRQKIMTSAQTPVQIAESADITLHSEDIAEIQRSDNILVDGAALQLVITRATPFELTLYGETMQVRTQANTVSEFLKEKGIELSDSDRMSTSTEAKITKDLKLRIWREGKQTITVDEAIDFEVEQIQDANREIGYKSIRTPGVKGQASVTYEVTIRDGKEVSRKKITSVTKKQPVKQVEVVGSKPSFSGDFQDALAKLRSCEGGYTSWNPAGPYYGAYQFDRQTWGTVADPAKYGNATPAEQDEAAYQLYLRRGWQPWPHCGAGLPDIYR